MYKVEDKVFRDASFEFEKFLISGILRYPDLYDDLDNLIITSSDFNTRIHQDSWIYFGEILHKTGKISYEILGMKLMELKLNYGMDLTPLEYLKALYHISVNKESINTFAAKLKTLSGRKNIIITSLDVANSMLDFKSDLSHSELVNEADSKFFGQINLFDTSKDNHPIDVFDGLEEKVENASNDQKTNEIVCPFERMNKLYGSFIPGELYFWCARPKASKSTFLMNLAYQCSVTLDDKVKALYIDTELQTEKVQYRLLSAISGVNEYYIRTKKWRLNENMVAAVRKAWPQVKLWTGLVSHIYVANMKMEDVISIIRRWVRKNNDDSKKIVLFDYLKLGDEFHGVSNNMRPDLVLGRKVDLLKKAGEELGIVVCSAAQNNRSGEVGRSGNAKERRDDGGVIGQSDQISQFASNIYLMGRLTIDELQELQGSYGISNATHFCKSIYSRNLGEEGAGFNDLIKIECGDKVEWKENLLYYNIDSFLVSEVGDLASLIKSRGNYKLNYEDHFNDGHTL